MARIVQASLAALLLLPMVRAQDPLLPDQLEPQAHLSPHPRNLCLSCALSEAQFAWLVSLPAPTAGHPAPLCELERVPLPQDPVLI